MTAKYTPENMKENNKYFDGYVVASDVLWYYDAFIRQGYNFLLDFADDSKRKISYSTSFGNSVRFFPEDEKPYAKYLMHRFDHVSVREIEGVELCKKHFDINATQVMDPVFICDKSEWQKIANNAQRRTSGKYLFAYVLDPSIEKAKALSTFAKKLGLKLVTITDKQNNPDEKMAILKDYGNIPNATIEEFVYHLMNAEFVVADSFHGFCFSMIFNKHFYAVANRVRGGSRFDTLSALLGIEDRLIESFDELSQKTKEDALSTDLEGIQKRINAEAERSKKWFHNALFSKKEHKEIPSDIRMQKDLYLAGKRIDSMAKTISSLEDRIKALENK